MPPNILAGSSASVSPACSTRYAPCQTTVVVDRWPTPAWEASDIVWDAPETVWGALDIVGGALDIVGGALDIVWRALDIVWRALDIVWRALDIVWGALDIVWEALDIVWGALDKGVFKHLTAFPWRQGRFAAQNSTFFFHRTFF